MIQLQYEKEKLVNDVTSVIGGFDDEIKEM